MQWKQVTCVLTDDVAEIMDKVKNAEVVVFATPIYYYEMSGQMKTVLLKKHTMVYRVG